MLRSSSSLAKNNNNSTPPVNRTQWIWDWPSSRQQSCAADHIEHGQHHHHHHLCRVQHIFGHPRSQSNHAGPFGLIIYHIICLGSADATCSCYHKDTRTRTTVVEQARRAPHKSFPNITCNYLISLWKNDPHVVVIVIRFLNPTNRHSLTACTDGRAIPLQFTATDHLIIRWPSRQVSSDHTHRSLRSRRWHR